MVKLLILLLSAALAQAGEIHLVAAGVEQYDDPGIAPLRYAVADARAVADGFRAAGVPERNVALLVSGAEDRLLLPTRANILRALQNARTRARGGDLLIFLFSGHGMEKNGAAYLLTVESNRDLLDETALPMSVVNKALAGYEGGQVLFIIDACRNDPDAGKAQRDAALDESFAKGLRPRLLRVQGKTPQAALLLACDIGQRAWEMPEEQHGAFTWWLLRGLSGEAGGDGPVKLTALAEYLRREVPAWARRAHREQTPRFENPSGGEVLLPRLPGQAAPPPVTPPATDRRPEHWPEYLDGYQPPKGLTWASYRVSAPDGMPQVLIPAGSFLMGAAEGQGEPQERPQRKIAMSAFWMDLHEVTVAQFQRFCAATGTTMSTKHNQQQFVPVVDVTWDEARAYAKWARRELPSEAQWERAARGGLEGKLYPWGDQWDAKQANNARLLKIVCQFQPNGFGLFDMTGNVMEWCRDTADQDWYRNMPDKDPVNAVPGELHVARGGCAGMEPKMLRVSARYAAKSGMRDDILGFRCAAPAR